MAQPGSLQSVSTLANTTRLVAMVAVCSVLIAVGLKSPNALLAVLSNGGIALAIIFAAFGLGAPILRIFNRKNDSAAWMVLPAVGLGLGSLSLLVLGIGSLAILNRVMWLTITAILVAPGLWQASTVFKQNAKISTAQSDDASPFFKWLWLLIVPFAAYALLAATLPPGILWPAEGNGYDALEYHLGAPRDYLDAGKITYLPHNIYANFPANTEMLYLLAMILHGDPIHAGLTCQLLHAMFGALAVAAIWLAGSECSRFTGRIAAILAGTSPFLVYLSGLAYVEHGLLLFAALAIAAAIRSAKPGGHGATWSFLAGLFAGMACGCKYTGVTAVALPLLVSMTFDWFLRRREGGRSSPVTFAVGAALAFSPWLVKNQLATGNPVFPLGYSVIGANDGIWTDALAQQWDNGHQPAAKDRPFARRLARLVDQVLWSDFFGWMIPGGIAGSLLLLYFKGKPDEWPLQQIVLLHCGTMIVIGLVIWVGFTHLVDRFAFVLIAPCAVLGGLLCDRVRTRHGILGTSKFVLALLLLATYNMATVWNLFSIGKVDQDEKAPKLGELFNYAFGRADLMVSDSPVAPPNLARVNRELREGKRILVVADAKRFYLEKGADYCVVFNRNPFAEAAEKISPTELVAWLREKGYAFVYSDWSEMGRLQKSYGFWPSINVELFGKLVEVGLKPVEDFKYEPNGRPYATLFVVP